MASPNAGIPAEDDFGVLSECHQLLQTLEAMQQFVEEERAVEPDSVFSASHELTLELTASDTARELMASAYSNLSELRPLLGLTSDGSLLSSGVAFQGFYALIRSALECAGTSLWVMKPGDAEGCLSRALDIRADELNYRYDFYKEVTEDHEREPPKVKRDELRELASEAGIHDWKFPSRHMSVTQVLKEVQSFHPLETMPKSRCRPRYLTSWFATWQLCSGATHGKKWVNKFLFDVHYTDGDFEGEWKRNMQIDLRPVRDGLAVATHMLSIAAQEYLRLSGKWETVGVKTKFPDPLRIDH